MNPVDPGECETALSSVVARRSSTAAQFAAVSAACAEAKGKAVAEADEAGAKTLWVYGQVATTHQYWAEAFELLKSGQFYDAWCRLEQCEVTMHFVEPHLPVIGGDRFGLAWIEDSIARLQSLYPYALFFSPGIVELERKCSICNARVTARTRCGHEVGEIYRGEMCSRVVTRAEFLEFSLVEQPVQKYSVPFLKDESTGEHVDHYNYSLVKYAVSALPDRFTDWTVELTTRKYPIERFSGRDPQAPCPCGSKTSFAECCSGKSEVEMPHYAFTFSTEPEDVPREALLLDGQLV